VRILLLSAGGGGGNILRSLKSLFYRDIAVAEKTDAAYAQRLHDAVTMRFLDTNEFSLLDVPAGERLLIGPRTTGHLGARHNPDVARQALEESSGEVAALMRQHSMVILIATGGKGTGAGTLFPLAQMAREQKKLVLPVFVRPSFERHEVDKRRYDHAVQVAARFDAAQIRLMEILNDRGYLEDDPQPQSVIWERMNLPIARGLRGLIYVLWELSQVDPSDLSVLFAGHGRLRMAFAEIDPPAGEDPTAAQVDDAVRRCGQNQFYAFSKPAGTSLVCIQGQWSNVVDARIKGQLAALSLGTDARSRYVPLYARTVETCRPWGVTALFAEYTGVHQPIEIDWSFATGRRLPLPVHEPGARSEIVEPVQTEALVEVAAEPVRDDRAALPVSSPTTNRQPPANFPSLWELAVAVNRSDPIALAVAANGASQEVSIDSAEVRKLLGTFWFRTVVPRLSAAWKARILDVLDESAAIPNHRVKRGRDIASLSELSYEGLQELSRTSVPDAIRSDLDFLLTVARLFGADALKRLRFVEPAVDRDRSRFSALLQLR
jgi:cell division GTPase FtsZ